MCLFEKLRFITFSVHNTEKPEVLTKGIAQLMRCKTLDVNRIHETHSSCSFPHAYRSFSLYNNYNMSMEMPFKAAEPTWRDLEIADMKAGVLPFVPYQYAPEDRGPPAISILVFLCSHTFPGKLAFVGIDPVLIRRSVRLF